MAPTVLFVPGAWHTAAHFAPVCDLLHVHGYETSCPKLPSSGGLVQCSVQDDADAVKAELDRLFEQGADVLLVGHSYGGIVVTEAALAEYNKAARTEKGLAGGVIHILYLCALVLQPGMTPSSLCVEGAPELAKLTVDHTTSTCRVDNPEEVFFNDLPLDEQAYWTSELKPMPLVCLGAFPTYAGYLHYLSTYLFCTNDQTLALERQKLAVSLGVADGAHMNTVTCDAGHSPYLSRPEVVLRVINDVCHTK